jgi:hypothetical protein
LITAERFNNDLTLQFGLLASECSDDDDYLEKSLKLIKQWRQSLKQSIEYIFFDDIKPDKSSFEVVLNEIAENIEKVQKIPVSKRKFE